MRTAMNVVVSTPYLALVIVTLITYTIHVVGSRILEYRSKSFLKDIVVPAFTYISYLLIFSLMMAPFIINAISNSQDGRAPTRVAGPQVLFLIAPCLFITHLIMLIGGVEQVREYDNSGYGGLEWILLTLVSSFLALITFSIR